MSYSPSFNPLRVIVSFTSVRIASPALIVNVYPSVSTSAPVVVISTISVPVVITSKSGPVADLPFTLTVIGPLVAPCGTRVCISVSVELKISASTSLNRTDTSAVSALKLLPVIVTSSPIKPLWGSTEAMTGAPCSTMNSGPVTLIPFTLTVILPFVAPSGTLVCSSVSEADRTGAETPLN